jgi:catechol 2,3-dioxygenase-like lactoylglutathione lyase family enzyme
METIAKPKFELSHVGINSENEKDARDFANLFSTIFNFGQIEGPSAIFVDKSVEIMKSKGFGKYGHIAFYTENVPLAVKYLEDMGIEFNYQSVKRNVHDEITIIYLEQEIGGFAIHLTSNKK